MGASIVSELSGHRATTDGDLEGVERPLLSVVIPAFNEAPAIIAVVEQVQSLGASVHRLGLRGPELIVVDDGSTDRTGDLVERCSGVRLIRHRENRGYGAALKTGLAAAGGDLIAFLDADGTYAPEHVPRLCQAALEGADMVIGSRMAGADSAMPATRRLGNRLFAKLIGMLSDHPVRDCASGMRVVRRTVLPRLYPLPDGLNFTPIMSLRAIQEGLKLVEVPIPYGERLGESKLRVVHDGWRYACSIVWTTLGYNPVRVLGTLGAAGVALAVAVALALVLARLHGVTTLGPWGVAAVFSALVAGVSGVSLFSLGATFNYLLALIRKRPGRVGLFGRPLFDPPLEHHFGWLGAAVGSTGVVVAALALSLGLQGWEIARLWLYLVGSALLMLIGLQLVISWAVMRTLRDVVERDTRVRDDLGTSASSTHTENAASPADRRRNLGTRRIVDLPQPRFPDADPIVREHNSAHATTVDVLLVNPPAPDGGIWIRSQHRVGRRSRENMVWPQVSLAQLAALLSPDYSVRIVDAIAERMSWPEFATLLRGVHPRYYLTHVSAPTLTNDMYGVFLAKSVNAATIAFGTHVTPMARETLHAFPALDFVLRGEPELTFRELIDTCEAARGRWQATEAGRLIDAKTGLAPEGHALMWKMWSEADPQWRPAWAVAAGECDARHVGDRLQGSFHLPAQFAAIKGLGWRAGGEVALNAERPFFKSLDDLPMPRHELLPLDRYRMPMIRGAYTFIVTSRGCPAGCTYCIKHVTYQYSVRLRSPQKLVEEMVLLQRLGVRHIHMYADLFTVNRDQVVELCRQIIEAKLKVSWTCNSRVDYVDEEMLQLMGRAGCMLIAWGIESGNELILKRAHKGYKMEQAHTALRWAKRAGIKNWGYFIIGLPGETVDTIKETIAVSKSLPLDIALFHVAAPYPGTPLFFDVVKNGWFRPGTNWEEIDMDQATVLDYPDLKAEQLLYWQKRAFREWALRPGPAWTFLKSMNSWHGFKSAVDIGLQTLGWVRG